MVAIMLASGTSPGMPVKVKCWYMPGKYTKRDAVEAVGWG